jgi:hypothetical protein
MKYPHNTKVVVSDIALHHANKVGWIEFYGESTSDGVVVLRPQAGRKEKETELFVVKIEHIQPIA